MKGLFKQYNYYFTEEQYKDIWENALFVFDTNTLLNLYRYQEETRSEFLNVLDMISNRIWLPHHVALEFQRNRLNVICEQKELFSKTRKAVESTGRHLNTELEKLRLNKRHSSIKVDELLDNLKKLSENFVSNLNDLKSSQQHLSKSDDLKEKLDELFDRKVGPAPKNQKEIDDLYKTAESRYKNKIPPGYLDNEKIDICVDATLIYQKKFGDFLVWEQILSHSKENEIKQLVFITNDLKEDWWSKYDASGEKFNQPRPELIDEALYRGGINDFIMYDSEKFLSNSSKFLNTKISDSSVKEIRDTIDIYNEKFLKKNDTYTSLDLKELSGESESMWVEIIKKLALDKVKTSKSQIVFENYKNKGILNHQTDVLECQNCELDTMIPEELSSSGYKCIFCENEEIEVICDNCGQEWSSFEIKEVDWTDDGHTKLLCPICRHDPRFVKDD